MTNHRSPPGPGFTLSNAILVLSLLDTILAPSAMKKNKKTKAAKAAKSKKPGLLGGAAKSLKKLGKGTAASIGKLSTAQKVVAGTALSVLSLRYLLKQRGKSKAIAPASPITPASARAEEVEAAEHNLSALVEEQV